MGGADRDHTEVWTVAAAGGPPRQITNNGRAATRPIWAPDGGHVLFHLQTTFGGHTITEVQPDGTGQRDLGAAPDTATAGAPGSGPPSQCGLQQENLFPAPSPDGKAIAFHSNRTCNNDVFVMDADGAAVTDLTNAPSGEVYPSWAPDSSRLVFSSNRDGAGYRLYIVARDGTHLAPLTSGSGEYDDTFPTWSPLPQP